MCVNIARMKKLEYAPPDEISYLIYNLKSSKNIGPYSIHTKIMKISKESLYPSLNELMTPSPRGRFQIFVN